MTPAQLIDLKERIALNEAFTPDERTLLLMAIDYFPGAEIEMHAPPNYMGRIEQIWAYLSIDGGGEGLCAAPIGQHTLPLIAADRRRLENLKPLAIHLARTFGRPIRLARFRQREDVEIIQP